MPLTRNTGNITWEASIGLWYGVADDGSQWQVLRPKMTDGFWSASGPMQTWRASPFVNVGLAMQACEDEYTRRVEEAAKTPQARLMSLVAKWRSHQEFNNSDDEYGAGYATGKEVSWESCADDLEDMIRKVFGNG